jgi:hypothetical protein
MLASALCILLFFAILAIFDVEGGDTFFSTPSLFIPILLAFLTSFLAFASGIYSIVFKKGRSLAVFITTLMGLLVTIYGLASTLFSM